MTWRAVVVVAFSIVFFALVAPSAFARFPTSYTGAHILGTKIEAVDTGSPAERAGLHLGDEIGCVNTRDFALLRLQFKQAAYVPDVIHLCVSNAVPRRSIAFSAARGPLSTPFYGNTILEGARLLSYAVFLFVGCILVILRPSVMTWLLFGYCLFEVPVGAAYQAYTTLSPPVYAVLIALFSPTAAIASVFLFLFALLVPEERVPSGWRRWTFWIVAIGALSVILANSVYNAMVRGFLSPLDWLQLGLSTAITVALIAVIIARLLTMEAAPRARFWWVAVALVIGVVMNYLRQGSEAVWPGVFGTLTVIMPLLLMYSIVRRHVIDIRFVIGKAVVYGAFMSAVVGAIAIVDWGASKFLSGMRLSLTLDALIAIASGLLMHRLTPILENWVDSIVYQRKHAAEIYLRRLARTLPRAEREETIDRALVEDPCNELELSMAAVFHRNGNAFHVALSTEGECASTEALDRDHDLIRFLIAERTRIHIHDLKGRAAGTFADGGGAFAIPIFNGDDLFGFTLYGVHRDGTRLDPDEEAVLEFLAESASQAYIRVENTRLRAIVGSTTLGAPQA